MTTRAVCATLLEKLSRSAPAWSISEYCRAQRQTSGSASSITLRIANGVLTPTPQRPLIQLSSRILAPRAGNAPLRAISYCSSLVAGEPREESGERSWTKATSRCEDAKPLKAVLDRAPHAVGRVIDHEDRSANPRMESISACFGFPV